MNLNRKSSKRISQFSLLIALVMLTTMFAVLHAQGYPLEVFVEHSSRICNISIADLLVSFFW